MTSGLVHGSAVAVDGKAALILGRSGSGKSSLVADIVSRGGHLIGDDQVEVFATAPPTVGAVKALHGLLEMRGIGLVRIPFQERAPLYVCVNLDDGPDARMPQPQTICITGVDIPLIKGAGLKNLAASLMIFLRSGGLAR